VLVASERGDIIKKGREEWKCERGRGKKTFLMIVKRGG
jgi:hypothetical protein